MAKKKPNKKQQTMRDIVSQNKLRMVRDMVNEQAKHADIKRAFAKEFNCQPRSAEPYITQVYRDIRAEIDRSPSELRADAYAFYHRVVSDTSLPIGERRRARECLDKITGVYAPVKFTPTDTTGKDLPQTKVVDVTVRVSDPKAELLKLLDETSNEGS